MTVLEFFLCAFHILAHYWVGEIIALARGTHAGDAASE